MSAPRSRGSDPKTGPGRLTETGHLSDYVQAAIVYGQAEPDLEAAPGKEGVGGMRPEIRRYPPLRPVKPLFSMIFNGSN